MTVLVTSTPVTVARKEAVGENLKSNFTQVSYICYPIIFRKKSVLALFNLSSKVNVVYPIFAKELGLFIRSIDVRAQKIDGTTLDTYGMVVAAFLMKNKANQVKFFEETFMMANVSPEVVLGMFFLTLSRADVDFLGPKFWWKTYIIKKVLPTTRRVELVDKEEFVAAALDSEHEIYVVHVGLVSSDVLLNSSPLDVYSSQKPQISGLITEEASIKVPAKYLDFADIFSPDLAFELPKHIGINDHAIELVDGQQSRY